VVLGAGGRSDSTVVSNTADLVYTSRPGDPGLAVAGNPASGERSGDPNDDGGAVNDYRDRDSAQLNNLFHVAFEDLKGSIEANDFDYNDLILEVQVDETLTEDGGRSRLEVTVEPVARGAGFRHQVNLDVAAAGPVEVARRLFSPEGQLLESDDTTLDGDWVTDVELFADSMVALPAWGGGSHPFSANTDPAQPRDEQVLGRKATVTIEMGDPGRNLPVPDDPVTLHLDEYLNSLLSLWIRVLDTNQVIRQRWVHAGATQDLVTADRYSNSPLIGFAVEQSEQFAIDWRWPVERAPVWQAYDRFSDHLLTGQTAERDWYLHPTDSQIWDSDQGTSASSIGLKSELGSVQTGRTFSDALSSVVSSSPAVADLDGDGSLEVVVGAFLNEIAVFSADGERLVSFDPAPGQALQSQASVTVADLDGDGDLELIRGYDDGRVVTLQHDGSPFAAGGFDLGGMTLKASVSVADLDGRPGPEMIICGGDGNLFVVSPTGVTLPGFPLHLGGDPDGGNNYVILPTPSVSDLDGDGSAEIVATTNDGKVWVDVAGTVLASPAVGDLDGDGVEEVVVAGDDGSVIALAADGSTLWTAQRPLGGPSSPALGDLDGDGLDDVVVGSIDGRVHGFRGDGRVLPGWPVTSESEIQSSPTVVDLDGDGVDEVVFASFDTRVYAVDGAGRPWSTPAGDPLAVSLGAIVFSSPAVADLDGNGRPEVVVGAHDRRVHVIETSGQVEGGAVIWPQFRGGGEHRGSAPAREAGPSSDEIFADGFESGATGAWSVQR
jgi:LruC domain-containing protein